MNETESTARPTTLRLDSDVRASLETYCAATRRTMNSAVNALLADALRTPIADGTAPLHTREVAR